MFLLLGNSPGLLLLANSELLLAPGLMSETAVFLSLMAAVCPDMGVELCWSCYDLMAGGGGGERCLSLMLIQKYGANAGEGQSMPGENKREFAVHSGSCNEKGGWGGLLQSRQSQLRLVSPSAGKVFELVASCREHRSSTRRMRTKNHIFNTSFASCFPICK